MPTSRALRSLAWLACFGALTDCQKRTWNRADAWYTPPTDSSLAARDAALPLPRDAAQPVIAARRADAEALLASKPWVALSDSDAAAMTGAPPGAATPPGAAPGAAAPDAAAPGASASGAAPSGTGATAAPGRYLLRGLMLQDTEATGGFSVSQTPGGDVFINWGCLGHSSRNMERRPIVVALPREPRSVFVTVSMAE
jgi:hypothetical protein